MAACYYDNHKASFEELLEMNNSASVRYKNLHRLAIELYTVFNGIFMVVEKCQRDIF